MGTSTHSTGILITLDFYSSLAAHRPHSANFLFPQHSILVTIPIPLEHQKYSTVRLYYTEVLFQERSFYRRTGFITAQNPFRQAAVRITPKKLSLLEGRTDRTHLSPQRAFDDAS